MSQIRPQGELRQKAKKVRQAKAAPDPMRQSARGQDCQLRLTGICNHDPETTVLCHLRMFGWAGTAQKPADYLAVFACSCCHDALDRRGTKVDVDPWDILRALGNTLILQEQMGTYGEMQ